MRRMPDFPEKERPAFWFLSRIKLRIHRIVERQRCDVFPEILHCADRHGCDALRNL